MKSRVSLDQVASREKSIMVFYGNKEQSAGLDQVTTVAALISKQRETYKPITCSVPAWLYSTTTHKESVTVFVANDSQGTQVFYAEQFLGLLKVMFQCQGRRKDTWTGAE